MNRRTFGVLAAGAVASAAIMGSEPAERWVLVAEQCSENGWKYSEESLRTMATSARGMLITALPPSRGDDRMGLVVGRVGKAEFRDGAVFVLVEWFTPGKPQDARFIAPWGCGQLHDGIVQNYRLERLTTTDYSCFANATRI